VEDEGIYVQYEWGYDMCGVGEREGRKIKEITMQCYTATLPPFTFHEKLDYALMWQAEHCPDFTLQ